MPASSNARRNNTNTSTARHAANTNTNTKPTTYQVYSPGFGEVLTIQARDVHQMPPSALNVTRMVLCANYTANAPTTSCAMGSRCKFVHADTSRARKQAIHVNYAWRSVEEVSYDRFPAGETFEVAPPNSKVATDVMDSHMTLMTKALDSKRRPLSHCAHFYFNRACNLGADCQFIHAVFIDPTAKPHQRAPVPSQLGEGRELQLSKKQREMRQSAARAVLLDGAATPAAASVVSSVLPTPRCAAAAAVRSPSVDSLDVNGSMSSVGVLSRNASSADVVLPSSSAASEASMTTSMRRGPSARFRHDPYSTVASRVVIFA